MKKILIVCGGEHQIPIVKKAKNMGYYVINSNLYKDSPSFMYADSTEVADVLDYKENLKIAKKYMVDGVIAEQNELSIYTVAYVSSQLGLPSITPDLAELYTNKYLMRKFCETNNFLFPRFKKCNSVSQAVDFFSSINKKMIMKPLDSYSSRGVFEIKTQTDCAKFFSTSSSFSKKGEEVILEEYIEGKEFTVDGLIVNGKHFTLAISEKSHYTYNRNIACSLYFSFSNSSYDYEALRRLNNKIIEQSGLKIGLTHCEYKYHEGEFYLIEMAARGGGNYIASKIVPVLSGIDNYKLYIQSALNDLPRQSDDDIISTINDNKHREAILYFFDIETQGKRVKQIIGVEKIKKMKGIIDFKLNFSQGDIVKKASNDGTRVGYFIAVGDNKLQLQNTIKNVLVSLKVEVE